jgi:hypothetical protein
MPEQLRTKIVKIRLSPEEYEKAEEMAQLQGITVSELFRQHTLKRPTARVVPIISKQTFLQLGETNASLKLIAQAAKAHVNSGQPSPLSPNLPPLLEQTKKLLKQVRFELITGNSAKLEDLSSPDNPNENWSAS